MVFAYWNKKRMFWSFWLIFLFFVFGAAAITGCVLGSIAFARTQ